MVQRVNFDIDMRVLRTNALGEVKLNNAIIVGFQPFTNGVQQYFQTTIEVALEWGREVEFKV